MGLFIHRGAKTTNKVLSNSFEWSTMHANIRFSFCASIECLSRVGERKISRSFGSSGHTTVKNDLLQFFNFEPCEVKNELRYVAWIVISLDGNVPDFILRLAGIHCPRRSHVRWAFSFQKRNCSLGIKRFKGAAALNAFAFSWKQKRS